MRPTLPASLGDNALDVLPVLLRTRAARHASQHLCVPDVRTLNMPAKQKPGVGRARCKPPLPGAGKNYLVLDGDVIFFKFNVTAGKK